jgi:hypothetical protein
MTKTSDASGMYHATSGAPRAVNNTSSQPTVVPSNSAGEPAGLMSHNTSCRFAGAAPVFYAGQQHPSRNR